MLINHYLDGVGGWRLCVKSGIIHRISSLSSVWPAAGCKTIIEGGLS